MKAKKLTSIKDYAIKKGITVQAVYKQIKEKRVKHVVKYGMKLIIE